MSEKNILAYFKSPEEAQKAADQLSSLGVIDMNIRRFSRYPGGGVEQLMNPISGNVPSLAYLTLGSNPTNRDASVLMAADVSASGMSDGGQDVITGRDILLAVVVDEQKHHQALDIVEKAGGMI